MMNVILIVLLLAVVPARGNATTRPAPSVEAVGEAKREADRAMEQVDASQAAVEAVLDEVNLTHAVVNAGNDVVTPAITAWSVLVGHGDFGAVRWAGEAPRRGRRAPPAWSGARDTPRPGTAARPPPCRSR